MGASSGRTPVALGWILPGVLVLVATVILVSAHGFDGLYGQDAFGYVNYALGPLREALLRGQGVPYFQQPPGFPIVIAAVSLVVGPDGRIGLGISVVAGALVPLATALLAAETLGRRLTGRAATAVPIMAALIAALPGQLWQSSAVAMSDTMSVALATTAAWAACRYARVERARWLLLAAAAVAAAIDTRWVYGFVAVPVAAVGLVGLRMVWRADRRRAIGHAAAAVLVGVTVLAPVVGPMGVALARGSTVPFSADFGAYPWDPFNALRDMFVSSDGRLIYTTTSGGFYLGQVVAPYWFGPAGLLAIWGAAWVARRGGLAPAIVLLGWPAIVLGFLAGSPYQNTRFFLSAMPPTAIVMATGVWRLAAFVEGRLPRDRGPRRWAIVAAIGGAWLLVAMLVAGRFTANFIDRQAADLAAIRRLETELPAGARVISMGPTGAFVRDGVPDVVELFALDPDAAEGLLADGRPSYLVIDPASMAGQWAGRRPALTVETLRSARGLTKVDEAGGWTLYRIGRD